MVVIDATEVFLEDELELEAGEAEDSLALRRPSAFGSRGQRKRGTLVSAPADSGGKRAVAELKSNDTSISSSRQPMPDLVGSSEEFRRFSTF